MHVLQLYFQPIFTYHSMEFDEFPEDFTEFHEFSQYSAYFTYADLIWL